MLRLVIILQTVQFYRSGVVRTDMLRLFLQKIKFYRSCAMRIEMLRLMILLKKIQFF